MTLQDLNERVTLYTNLIEDSLATGDEESATELYAALERVCDKIDALMRGE